MLRYIVIILFLGIQLTFPPSGNGTDNEADESDKKQITLTRDISFGTNEEVVIGDFSSFGVDDNNRVYIADRDQIKVFVFDGDGNYQSSIGRVGEGPGEFSAITPVTRVRIHSGNIYIPDYPSASTFFPDRVQVFSTDDLSFKHTIKLIANNRRAFSDHIEGYYPQNIFPLDEDKFLLEYKRPRRELLNTESFRKYFIYNIKKNSIDHGPVFELDEDKFLHIEKKNDRFTMNVMSSFPFLSKSLFAVSPDGKVYTARTESFRIDVHTPGGEYIRSIEHPFEKVGISESELIELYQDYTSVEGDAERMIEEAEDLPEYWPALHDMIIDDEGRLWVATHIRNHDRFEWWIVEASGEVTAKFEWPADKKIREIKNGYVYTLENDDRGFIEVVRYTISGL